MAARFRGQQIAQKAMQLFLDFFQNECAGIVMLDEVRQENKAGIAFLLKFGFKIIEEREQTVLLKWVKAAGKEESNE